MSDDEIISVVAAHKEGKKIQMRSGNIPEWTDVVRNSPRWNFEHLEYRVAPEPRKPKEYWIDANASNGPWTAYNYNPGYPSGSLLDRCLVHVREIME